MLCAYSLPLFIARLTPNTHSHTQTYSHICLALPSSLVCTFLLVLLPTKFCPSTLFWQLKPRIIGINLTKLAKLPRYACDRKREFRERKLLANCKKKRRERAHSKRSLLSLFIFFGILILKLSPLAMCTLVVIGLIMWMTGQQNRTRKKVAAHENFLAKVLCVCYFICAICDRPNKMERKRRRRRKRWKKQPRQLSVARLLYEMGAQMVQCVFAIMCVLYNIHNWIHMCFIRILRKIQHKKQKRCNERS